MFATSCKNDLIRATQSEEKALCAISVINNVMMTWLVILLWSNRLADVWGCSKWRHKSVYRLCRRLHQELYWWHSAPDPHLHVPQQKNPGLDQRCVQNPRPAPLPLIQESLKPTRQPNTTSERPPELPRGRTTQGVSGLCCITNYKGGEQASGTVQCITCWRIKHLWWPF